MRKLIICMAIAAAAWLCSSCEHSKTFDSSLLKEETECLRIAGEDIFVYDPLTCQLAYNDGRLEFRVGTDTMSDYFTVKVTSTPKSKGQELKDCTLTYTDGDDVISLQNLTFKVKQMDSDGRVWLWNQSNKIFALVRLM